MASNQFKPVPKRLRYEILARDGHRCRYCGAGVEDGVKLHVDHVQPQSLGGTNDATNLVAACADCNSGKASVSPGADTVEQVNAQAAAYRLALEQVAAERRRRRTSQSDYVDHIVDELGDMWTGYTYRCSRPGCSCTPGHTVPLDESWQKSIERFVLLGLDEDDIKYFVPIAMKSKAPMHEKFSYFCGCCWNEIRDRQAEARDLLERGQ